MASVNFVSTCYLTTFEHLADIEIQDMTSRAEWDSSKGVVNFPPPEDTTLDNLTPASQNKYKKWHNCA